MKCYTAKSELSFNVRVGDAYRHVCFVAHTMGDSSFFTDDPRLQQAIEHHRYFGQYISVKTVVQPEKPGQNPQKGTGQAQAHKQLVMTFDNHADAKDYVADRWDISRTMLRTEEQIKQAAARHGVKIIIRPHSP